MSLILVARGPVQSSQYFKILCFCCEQILNVFYERHSDSTTLKNIGVKKVGKEKSGGKKKSGCKKKSGENQTKVGIK